MGPSKRIVGHRRSLWAKHRMITGPAHERGRDARYRKAIEVFAAPLADDDVEIRDLNSYDTALGLG